MTEDKQDERGRLARALGRAEDLLDRVKLRTKARFGLFRPLHIQVFRGHGTPERVRVIGRVLEETGTRPVDADASRFRNALNTFHRLESDEMPDARLRVRVCGVAGETTTDGEGFFAVDLSCEPPAAPGWHAVEATLLDSPAGQEGVTGGGELFVPASDCEFGVISDLDDTVVRTRARHRLTHARVLFTRNAMTQVPFPGVAEFYRLLLEGGDGRGANPIFYVSRSAWTLYDLFVEFLDRHDLPKGPMYLLDAAIIEEKSPTVGHEDHKMETIAEILETHATLPFVLIGDSGQGDAEVYLEAVRRWPGRIRAVYIRDVTDSERDEEVARVLARIEAAGVPALAADDTVALARHAEGQGLIAAGAAARVERERSETQSSR